MFEDYMTLEQAISEFPLESQLRVKEESNRLLQEYKTLQQFRKARKLTQKQLAEKLNISQVSVSKVENTSDMMLSTLKSYVTAMGGELELHINFPDRKPIPLTLEGL